MFTKYIIDEVIVTKNTSLLLILMVSLIAIHFAEGCIGFIKDFLFFRFEQDIIFEIQSRIFEKVLLFPKAFFEDKKIGYLMSRVSNDVIRLRVLFSSHIVKVITDILIFIGGVCILFALHWRLTLISLCILPFYFVTFNFLNGRIKQISTNVLEKIARVSIYLQESLSGIHLIKTFNTEKNEARKMVTVLRDSIDAGMEENTVRSFSTFVIGTIASVGTLLVIGYGAREVIYKKLTIGSFFAFNSYLAYLYGPSLSLANFNIALQSSLAAFERVFTLFGLATEEEQDRKKKTVTMLKGAIRVDRASFYYYGNGSNFIIKDISFSVEPGEVVALVGPSGGGKSTLISLLLQLYQLQQGKIYYDEIDSVKLKRSNIRDRFGVVSQDIFLFNDTIFNNIRYSHPEATINDVIHVSKLSNADDFISELKNGYDTKVGERGLNLSTGERQRISIARALLKDPDIFIFDEPTSALDALTEKAIKAMLFEKTNGKTTFIIAHRLSTVSAADKIIVLDKGRIVQIGSHEELIRQEGLYRRMCTEQMLVSG